MEKNLYGKNIKELSNEELIDDLLLWKELADENNYDYEPYYDLRKEVLSRLDSAKKLEAKLKHWKGVMG